MAPETGMGFHLVDIAFRDGTRFSNAVVLNGELAVLPEELESDEITEVQLR